MAPARRSGRKKARRLRGAPPRPARRCGSCPIGLDEELRRRPGADRDRTPVLASQLHRVCGLISKFDLDGLAWLEIVLFGEAEERGILVGDPRDFERGV